MFNTSIDNVNIEDTEEKKRLNFLHQQIESFNLNYDKILSQVEKLIEKKNLNIVQVLLI
jgi:hypothetical protein